MEELLFLTKLYDLYGKLLTEKQQKCVELHIYDDFSLAEIGDELGISRQAVYDNISRAKKTMESMEDKLGLIERYQSEQAKLSGLYNELKHINDKQGTAGLDKAMAHLADIIGLEQEETV